VALQGTIKDFALPDIFQLIGIQRKTGILSLEHGEDTVTIKFLDGHVVGADTRTETVEDRLGALLVRTGKITEAQLQEALRLQRNTLQRLGHLLVSSGYISEEELIEALRVQSSQIIYRLFRWRDGTYKFSAVDDVDYDQRHFVPISSETILMEGARMIDEWPIIERRIRSERVVLRKTEASRALELPPGSILDGDVPFDLGYDLDRPARDTVTPGEGSRVELSPEEREIFALVDGRRTVAEICDLTSLGEFDTWRVLSDLCTRSLLEEVRDLPAAEPKKAPGVLRAARAGLAWTLLVAAAAVGATGVRWSALSPWTLEPGLGSAGTLGHYVSLDRLQRIEDALQVFYLDTGLFPPELEALSRNGYVGADALADPWGRPYSYRVSDGGYLLQGHDADGQAVPELRLSRRFSSAQRMMLPVE
jgi:hypothetical protein